MQSRDQSHQDVEGHRNKAHLYKTPVDQIAVVILVVRTQVVVIAKVEKLMLILIS